MITRKEEFIPQFLKYAERRLNEKLREEGYEDEMFVEACSLFKEHSDDFAKMRFPRDVLNAGADVGG